MIKQTGSTMPSFPCQLNPSDLSATFQSLAFQPRNDWRRFPTLLILIINSSPSLTFLCNMIREPIVYWLYQTCNLLLQLQLKARVYCNYAPPLVPDHRNTRTLYILHGLSVSLSKKASRCYLLPCLTHDRNLRSMLMLPPPSRHLAHLPEKNSLLFS